MAMWGAIIAAAIGAASNIAASSMKGGAKAPAPGFGGAGKKIETPDVFGEKPQGAPQAGLAQALGAGGQQAPPQFGPQGMDLFAQEEQRRKLHNLLGG